MNNFKAKEIKVCYQGKKGSWVVFTDLCKGCGICLEKCPVKALRFGKDRGVYSNPTPEVEPGKCTLCGICEIFCPDCALKVKKND